MHTCETYKTWISALIDNEISEADRAALMEHLSRCEDCKAYLDDQLAIHEAVQALDCTAPVGLFDAVMARVRETAQDQPEKKVISFPRWKQIASIAACCAVIILGIFVSSEGLLTVEDSATSNCAAPQMAFSLDSAAETAETADAEECDSTAETESARTTPTAPESPADNGACIADSAAGYGQYGGIAEFARRITTDSDIAARWVRDTLGQEWISGTYYLLTADQYTELTVLLTYNGEAFVVDEGSEGSSFYQLLAK